MCNEDAAKVKHDMKSERCGTIKGTRSENRHSGWGRVCGMLKKPAFRKHEPVFFLVMWLAGVAAAGLFPGCQVREAPRLRILVSNDDGIDAPGLVALAKSLATLGTVTVAANPSQMSGVSHAMTSNALISVRESERDGQRWFAVDALPASCVRLALETLLPEMPDIVVAGVNRGETTGVVTFYSATVACAREASFKRIPAIAVHLQRGPDMDYALAARFTAAVVKALAAKGLRPDGFLNINIPALPREKIKGVLVTSQDLRPADEVYEKRESRDGETVFWATYRPLPPGREKTDVWAVANGYIAITPLTGDQTATPRLAGLRFLEKIAW
jgi:5'-nucleotidase